MLIACVPGARSASTFSVSVTPLPCSAAALAVCVPSICTPSMLTVYCALPLKAAWLIFGTSVSAPAPMVVVAPVPVGGVGVVVGVGGGVSAGVPVANVA